MEEENDQQVQSTLPEIVAKYKDHNKFYLKLDLAILGAIATVMSLLKLSQMEIYKGIVNYRKPFIFLIALIGFQLLLDNFLLGAWVTAKIKSQTIMRKFMLRTLAILSIAQIVVHLTLLFYSSGFIMGSLDYIVSLNNKMETLFLIQDNIESFQKSFHRYPRGWEELTLERPNVKKYIKEFPPNTLSFEPIKAHDYALYYKIFDNKDMKGAGDAYLIFDHQQYVNNKDKKEKSVSYSLLK